MGINELHNLKSDGGVAQYKLSDTFFLRNIIKIMIINATLGINPLRCFKENFSTLHGCRIGLLDPIMDKEQFASSL